ncbi:asparagine synthase-related protein, partial [Vibrio anguillarum]|uniref:asparagine synthase-related protein n=1 Tax=Vibrio anguillarum TaxID=55601 RepID=UPI002E17F36C
MGSALSGGLDSSSIVYLVNEQLRAQGKADLQETFSSVYKSDGTQNCDESVYIDLLAKALNVNSNQIEPQEGDIPVEHQKMIWAMENPPESTCMSGWHTFMKVKESGVK